MIGEELQSPSLVGGREPFQKQTAEQTGEYLDGEKEAGPAGNPVLTVGRQAAAGDDDVGVRMVAPTPIIP